MLGCKEDARREGGGKKGGGRGRFSCLKLLKQELDEDKKRQLASAMPTTTRRPRRPGMARQVQTAYPGPQAKRGLLCRKVVWHGMSKDMAVWCRDCQACLAAKVTKQPSVKVQSIPVSVAITHMHNHTVIYKIYLFIHKSVSSFVCFGCLLMCSLQQILYTCCRRLCI